MAIWVFIVSILALLSYLADVGVPGFVLLREPVPFLRASSISVALIVCCVLMLVRIARLARRGEREHLAHRVDHLETELKEIGQFTLKKETDRLVKSWQELKRQPSKTSEELSPEWNDSQKKEDSTA